MSNPLKNTTVYVFDSGPFIEFRNYPEDVFNSLYDNFQRLIQEGRILSCSEVLKEIEAKEDSVADWGKANKQIFEKPSENELACVRDIFEKHPNFENTLIKKKVIVKGAPAADIFVISKAKCLNASIVSTERFKEHSGKIPNVCKQLGIDHFSLFEFFRKEGWQF